MDDLRSRLLLMPIDEQRAMMRRLGLPDDMWPHKVLDFFSLPDDDDGMHMDVRPTSPKQRSR
jgi:hypothetical protein